MQRKAGSSGGESSVLTEIESLGFHRSAGLPVAESRLARNKKQAVEFSRELGFPVALKIVSPEIVHKSDIGGVKLGLKNVSQVKSAYDDILQNARKSCPEARLHGVSVQKMAPPGQEMIIGMFRDPQFGPVLMFGLGGVMVEIMKDVSFRLLPLSPQDAREMVSEIKGYKLLTGFRGSDPVNIQSVENLLLKMSDLIQAHPQIRELDVNPVMANKDGALIVDSTIIMEQTA